MIAAESVAKSPADGDTFLVASDSVFTLNPHRYSKVPYDTVRDFLPVTRLVTANLMRVTRPDFPATNMRDLIDYVKKTSGKHTYASVGAPFDDETYRVFRDEFNMPHVIEGFGMSEIPGALNNPFDGERRVRSMGKSSTHPDPAIKFTELKVVDDDGNTVAPGTIGELAVKTPTILQGYFRDPEQTQAAFRDGWFLTGDLASYDQDGYYWFVARKKDIIRKRGENISGAELDRVIGNHPAVLEAAAIPVPAPLGEDDILAAVVVRDGMQVTAVEIAGWCRAHLAAIKVPRYVVFVEALPHTPTHRVEKFKMRQDKTLLARALDLQA